MCLISKGWKLDKQTNFKVFSIVQLHAVNGLGNNSKNENIEGVVYNLLLLDMKELRFV